MRAAILRRRGGGDPDQVRPALVTSGTIAAGQGAVVFGLRALADLVELGGAGAGDRRRLLVRLTAVSSPLRNVDRARATVAARAG